MASPAVPSTTLTPLDLIKKGFPVDGSFKISAETKASNGVVRLRTLPPTRRFVLWAFGHAGPDVVVAAMGAPYPALLRPSLVLPSPHSP